MERRETLVRTYKGTDAFQDDSRKLAAQGWRVSNTTERRPRAGCIRLLLLWWWVLIFPPKPELVVTYERSLGSGQQAMAMPANPEQQNFCPKCGHRFHLGDKVCPNCGARLTR